MQVAKIGGFVRTPLCTSLSPTAHQIVNWCDKGDIKIIMMIIFPQGLEKLGSVGFKPHECSGTKLKLRLFIDHHNIIIHAY